MILGSTVIILKEEDGGGGEGGERIHMPEEDFYVLLDLIAAALG